MGKPDHVHAAGSPETNLLQEVRDHYADAARRVLDGRGEPAECCAATGCCQGSAVASCNPRTRDLYSPGEVSALPDAAVRASLGCGNPTALAELREGETVLDLGSGGGIDVLLSARRVGPTGRAYGLDMTDEMLALARQNAAAASLPNVEFLKGSIEAIPLPDESVDVIISNCVINLSLDKPTALAEAFRVLRPGGRFAVSDIVLRNALPPEARAAAALWVGCVAGALEEKQFLELLIRTGFEDPEIEPTRVYDAEEVRHIAAASDLDADRIVPELQGRVMSAFVRARKPRSSLVSGCCSPECCS